MYIRFNHGSQMSRKSLSRQIIGANMCDARCRFDCISYQPLVSLPARGAQTSTGLGILGSLSELHASRRNGDCFFRHLQCSFERVISSDETASMHKHAARDAGDVAELLVSHALPIVW